MGSASQHGRLNAYGAGDSIVIGLVNNMPDAALRTTEGQFRSLLSASALGGSVRLRTFFLPDVPRSDRAKSYLQQCYEPIANLWENPVDGLVVTGTEPRAPALTDEPYWDSLARLVDWAEDHTVSTIWSCLAAHAAVLHLDGVHRQPLGGKLSGVFGCRKINQHPILAGVPTSWRVPHSRYNGLAGNHLGERGYQILSASEATGPDIFVKQRASLFVFLHGHPEYDRLALFREYRRDITRFLSGARDTYPDMPIGYFDNETATAMAAFRRHAVRHRGLDLLESLPGDTATTNLMHTWHEVAAHIFANWLSYLAAHKLLRYLSNLDLAPVARHYQGGM